MSVTLGASKLLRGAIRGAVRGAVGGAVTRPVSARGFFDVNLHGRNQTFPPHTSTSIPHFVSSHLRINFNTQAITVSKDSIELNMKFCSEDTSDNWDILKVRDNWPTEHQRYQNLVLDAAVFSCLKLSDKAEELTGQKNSIVIVSGGIGSGKSFYLEKENIPEFSADTIKKLMRQIIPGFENVSDSYLNKESSLILFWALRKFKEMYPDKSTILCGQNFGIERVEKLKKTYKFDYVKVIDIAAKYISMNHNGLLYRDGMNGPFVDYEGFKKGMLTTIRNRETLVHFEADWFSYSCTHRMPDGSYEPQPQHTIGETTESLIRKFMYFDKIKITPGMIEKFASFSFKPDEMEAKWRPFIGKTVPFAINTFAHNKGKV